MAKRKNVHEKIADLALRIREKYDVSYRTQVNLEGTMNGLVDKGLTYDQIEDVMEDIFGNLAFVNLCPVLVKDKGLIRVQIVVPGEKVNAT